MAQTSIPDLAQSLLASASASHASASPQSSLARSVTMDRVIIGPRIGEGAFAKVYRGTCAVTGAALAIKVEVEQDESRRAVSPLTLEWGFYAHLQRTHATLQRCPAIPRALYLLEPSVSAPPPFVRIMVMQMCDEGLVQAVQRVGTVPPEAAPSLHGPYPGARLGGFAGFLQVRHAAWVLQQLIAACREVHARHIVHRDIKPANVVVHRGRLLLIDFGPAKRVMQADGTHIPHVQRRRFAGTPLYASYNVHQGVQTTRRDDVWACCITALALAGWPLPWGHLSSDVMRAESPRIIRDMPTWLPSVPRAFRSALQSAVSLQFDEEPPYEALCRALDGVAESPFSVPAHGGAHPAGVACAAGGSE